MNTFFMHCVSHIFLLILLKLVPEKKYFGKSKRFTSFVVICLNVNSDQVEFLKHVCQGHGLFSAHAWNSPTAVAMRVLQTVSFSAEMWS